MTIQELEEIFTVYGCNHLYKTLKFPIWLTGIMDEIEIELLEDFFESYDFESVDKIFVDEFLYQFRTFVIAKKSFS